MTEKQLNKIGLFRSYGNSYGRWHGGVLVDIRINKEDTLDTVWDKIYDAIYKIGHRDGRDEKIREIKKILDIVNDS